MIKIILLTLVTLFTTSPAYSESGQLNDVFVPAELISGSLDYGSYYPGGEANMGRTGRVLMSLMIDEKGRAFAPLVLISNNQRFNKAAKKSVLNARFEPGTLNGEPIISSISFMAVFELDIMSLFYRKSNKMYHKHLEKFNAEISSEQPDPLKLRKLLKKMVGTTHGNNFIRPVISRARYDYAALFGSDTEKIASIKELLLSSTFGVAATRNMPAQFELIELLINSNHYGEALHLYNASLSGFNSQYQKILSESFGEAIQEILDIRDSDQANGRQIELNKEGFTYLSLFKRSFTFTNVVGELKELKFRCEKKFQEISFQAESDYIVPDSWGECLLEITGKKESKALLIQQ